MNTIGNGKGIINEDALNIFTDGSSYPNKKRAAGIGIRFVWVDDSGHEKREDFAPTGWESATIDEVEIKACSEALKEAKRLFPDLKKFNKIKLFSDSSYVVNNFHLAINVWPKKNGSNRIKDQ